MKRHQHVLEDTLCNGILLWQTEQHALLQVNADGGLAVMQVQQGRQRVGSSTGTCKTHLILGYLGSLACLRVFGLWKTTLNLGFLCFFHVLFFTCFAAFCAFALAGSLPPWAAEQTHTSVHGDVSQSTGAGMSPPIPGW